MPPLTLPARAEYSSLSAAIFPGVAANFVRSPEPARLRPLSTQHHATYCAYSPVSVPGIEMKIEFTLELDHEGWYLGSVECMAMVDDFGDVAGFM